jgi:hypothetical protein
MLPVPGLDFNQRINAIVLVTSDETDSWSFVQAKCFYSET